MEKQEKTITITKSELKEMIRREIGRQLALNENAMARADYADKLFNILQPTLDNLLCIAIFHTQNMDIVPHWANRAIGLPRTLIQRKLRQGNVDKAVENTFTEHYGKGYNEIEGRYYSANMTYYDSQIGSLRMKSPNSPEWYANKYNPIVKRTLDSLKVALIQHDTEIWRQAVESYVQEVCGTPLEEIPLH